MGALLVIALAGCLFAAFTFFRPSVPRTHKLEMTTDISRRNVSLAKQLRANAADYHLDIALTAKEYGTLDALEEIDSPSKVKLALIVGGVTERDYVHVRTVTTLTTEHLHLLVKPELAEKGIEGLRGRRIFLGPETTASYQVARDVLEFAGLHPAVEDKNGGYIIDNTPREQALRELTHIQSMEGSARAEAVDRLPDAVMVLAPLPSPFAKPLITDFGYRLVPLPFAEAYGLDHLNSPNAEGVQIDRSMLTAGAIPAYTYRRNLAEPAKDCPTICAPLILVADDEVDPEAVAMLLKTVYDSPLKSVIRPPALSEQVNNFPRHPGTELYLHRNDPLLTPEAAYKFGTLAGGIGALLPGFIGVYGYLRLRKLRRFESYYREIGQIEMLARGLEQDPAAPTDPESLRTILEERLSKLKCKVLEDFAQGGLKGEDLMAAIVVLINDTRDTLAGMVKTRPQASQSLARDNAEHVC